MSIEKKSISGKTIELIWNDVRGLANAWITSRASGRRAIKSCSEGDRSFSIFLLWECDSLQTLTYHSLLLHLVNYPYCLLILFKNQAGVNKSAIALSLTELTQLAQAIALHIIPLPRLNN